MTDIRCAACAKKLASGQYVSLTIKCGRCGTLNSFIERLPTRAPQPERPERQDLKGYDHGRFNSRAGQG